jgi:hypothetical protein
VQKALDLTTSATNKRIRNVIAMTFKIKKFIDLDCIGWFEIGLAN